MRFLLKKQLISEKNKNKKKQLRNTKILSLVISKRENKTGKKHIEIDNMKIFQEIEIEKSEGLAFIFSLN